MGESRSVYVTLAFAGVALMVCLIPIIAIFIVAFVIPTIINLFVIISPTIIILFAIIILTIIILFVIIIPTIITTLS